MHAVSIAIYMWLPLIMVIGHVLILPVIFYPGLFNIDQRLSLEEQIDIALIVAPLTSVSTVGAVKFAVDNRFTDFTALPPFKNYLFPIVLILVTLTFFSAIYFVLYKYQTVAGQNIVLLKSAIGVIEVFLGASFAAVSGAIFSTR